MLEGDQKGIACKELGPWQWELRIGPREQYNCFPVERMLATI